MMFELMYIWHFVSRNTCTNCQRKTAKERSTDPCITSPLLQEDGTLSSLRDEYISIPSSVCGSSALSTSNSLSFAQLSGLWVILAAGIALGVLVLAGRIAWDFYVEKRADWRAAHGRDPLTGRPWPAPYNKGEGACSHGDGSMYPSTAGKQQNGVSFSGAAAGKQQNGEVLASVRVHAAEESNAHDSAESWEQAAGGGRAGAEGDKKFATQLHVSKVRRSFMWQKSILSGWSQGHGGQTHVVMFSGPCTSHRPMI